MTLIAGKPYTQLLNLNILDELRINGIPLDTAETVVVEITSNYTAMILDDVIICTSGAVTVNLFTVTSSTKNLFIKSLPTAGIITVDPFGSETIEGAETFLITPGGAIKISRSTGGWVVI